MRLKIHEEIGEGEKSPCGLCGEVSLVPGDRFSPFVFDFVCLKCKKGYYVGSEDFAEAVVVTEFL
jgi:hypothetical protein